MSVTRLDRTLSIRSLRTSSAQITGCLLYELWDVLHTNNSTSSVQSRATKTSGHSDLFRLTQAPPLIYRAADALLKCRRHAAIFGSRHIANLTPVPLMVCRRCQNAEPFVGMPLLVSSGYWQHCHFQLKITLPCTTVAVLADETEFIQCFRAKQTRVPPLCN